MTNLADFERINTILQSGVRMGFLNEAQQNFLMRLFEVIGRDVSESTNFSGLAKYVSENRVLYHLRYFNFVVQ